LADGDEVKAGTSPLFQDSDADEVNDNVDAFPMNKAETADTDEDGVGDNADEDDDNDGLNDVQELEMGLDPLKADTDDDTLSDKDEIEVTLTDPLKADTDEDGVSDGVEVQEGTDPNSADSVPDLPDEEGEGGSMSMQKVLTFLAVVSSLCVLFFAGLYVFKRKES